MTARDPLREPARELPRQIQPPRDLWPDIAARLDAAEREPAAATPEAPTLAAWRRRLGIRPDVAGALLVAATLAVVLLAGPDRGQPPTAGPVASSLDTLEDGYASVRADLVTVLDSRCGQLPDAACDGLRTGLSELDQTTRDLESALRQAPRGSETARKLAVRYQRTLEQARGLAGHAARL